MMKKFALAIAAAGMAATTAAPAMADNHGTMAKSPEIVERNSKGKATKVRIDDKVYDVCMSEAQDGCINPRAAGLNWGDRPLDYWPGQPASQS